MNIEAAAHALTREQLEKERTGRLVLEQRIDKIKDDNLQETKKLNDKMNLLEGRLREKEEKEFNKKCHFGGWVLTITVFGVPYVFLIALTEIMKGYFSEISWYSVCAVAVMFLLTLLVAFLFSKGKKWCFNVVRKRLKQKEKNEQ